MKKAGLVAIFAREDAFLKAVRAAREAGFLQFEALSPYAIEELFDLVPPAPKRKNRLGMVGLGGGLFGVALGLLMQWYSNSISYSLDSGGKPLFSWPNFVPICFAMMILCAVLSIFVSLFFFTALPQPYHSAFNAPALNLSEDRFYLYFPESETNYPEASKFAKEHGANSVEEVAE